MLVYAAFSSPRLRYALDMVLGRILAHPYRLTHDRVSFCAASGELRWSYGEQLECTATEQPLPYLPQVTELLSRSDLAPLEIPFDEEQRRPFSTSTRGGLLSYDALSLAFYHLTRYEEYLPGERDAHGRYTAAQSRSSAWGTLELPLVDVAAHALYATLREHYPRLALRQPLAAQQMTYDIDIPFAYGHRPLWRTVGAIGKEILRLKHARLGQRLRVALGVERDPYDTLDTLLRHHRYDGIPPAFFFLLNDYRRPYDTGLEARHVALWVRRVADNGARVGLHPSYASAYDARQLEREVERLQAITGQAVQHSRQHYLRFRLPDTYRHLLSVGILHDYSMCYADAVGWRAGTSYAYPWYDLTLDAPTELTLHPTQAMEVTLRQYMSLPSEQARERVAALWQLTRQYGGVFRALGHNNNLPWVRDLWVGMAQLLGRLP